MECLYEDRSTLLWLGTSEGLFSYDGLEFKPYLKTDSTSNHVRAIYHSRKNTLWVGYQDGSVYFLDNHQLKPWTPEEGTPAVPVTGFAEDGEGRFWLATYGEGLYYQDGRHVYNMNVDDGLPGNDVYDMLCAPSGKIWVGTDGGISICEIAEGRKNIKTLNRKDGLPDDIVRALKTDEAGNIWVGTYDGGVCCYDAGLGRFVTISPEWQNGIVNTLEIFEGSELWAGTEGNGIWVYSFSQKKWHKMAGAQPLSTAKIYDLHKDTEGNIWILSNEEGVWHANRRFEFMPTDFENIQAIFSDRDDELWVGTETGLFRRKREPSGHTFIPVLPEKQMNIISLYEDDFGNMWLGTFGEGVIIYNKKTRKKRHLTEKDGLTNGSILSINGVDGRVWLGTLGGVTEFDLSTDPMNYAPLSYRNFNQEDGLGTNFIYCVFVDTRGRVWFGTDGKGISVLENGQIVNYPEAHLRPKAGKPAKKIELKAVYSITEDPHGHIWFCTARGGVFEFDGEYFEHLSFKEGIRELDITGLFTDARGNILIVHPTGIDLLQPESHHLMYFGEEVGIQNIDPNLNVLCRDQYDRIWIGCKNEIIRYVPLREKLEIHPRTRLLSVSVFLEPFDFERNNVLSHTQNNLVFEYLGLWYTNPELVQYRYQLEGYNPDWVISKDRKATYANLPPGKYTFRVTSTENDAWSDEPVVAWHFEILPPVWQRWWFIVGCLLIAMGLFYGYLKARDYRIQRVNLLEREKAESQLAALKAQINPHFLFNSFNTLIATIEEDPEVAVEYVEKLSDFYRSMLQYRDKEVIPLKEEVALVQNYTYLLKKRFGDNFKVDIQLNGEEAFVAPLTLQVLVENAVKHNIISKTRPLNVRIRMDEEEAYVVVENNLQRKLKAEVSTRFGLQSLIKRYELLTGKKIKIEETETTFLVSIPVVKK
ncbi:MAG: hypothetical protein D6714_11720 [Bacteroidetes bacterium]|nr:MAG: hypothetical protein D6714_11720 [Bacteroidota bacterium]